MVGFANSLTPLSRQRGIIKLVLPRHRYERNNNEWSRLRLDAFQSNRFFLANGGFSFFEGAHAFNHSYNAQTCNNSKLSSQRTDPERRATGI